MFKKIITIASILGLSFSIASATSAEEITKLPVSPQLSSQVQFESIMPTLAPQKRHTEFRYYTKKEYIMAADIPEMFSIVTKDGFYGNIFKKNVQHYGKHDDWWKVEYSGLLTKFME